MPHSRKDRANLITGLGFLAPNIVGFLAFTLIPLVLSLILAFTNWNLRLHNQYRDESLRFVGLQNFVDLWHSNAFLQYLLNTLYLMMGMPFGIAASLIAAILLSKNMRGESRRAWIMLLAGATLVAASAFLAAWGAGATAMTLLIVGVTGGIAIAGVGAGTTLYRTLFYLPHFTAGVATYILWKAIYSPQTGPINNFLAPVLGELAKAVNAAPAGVIQAGLGAGLVVILRMTFLSLRRLGALWLEGDVGTEAAASGALVLMIVNATVAWLAPRWALWFLGMAVVILGYHGFQAARADHTFARRGWAGTGIAFMLVACTAIAQLIVLGLGITCHYLPSTASDGLNPPNWLADYHWAKPALMVMGFWAAVGSNTMLLYLAALTNVPQELYEAADIDGATRLQRFWNITWPQLAPTTFFIVVMGVIGGLQGGFDQARVMTNGGPAGSTTTLSFYIFNEGFENLYLGYASAVSWVLFAMVLLITLVNWKFGNKYVNE